MKVRLSTAAIGEYNVGCVLTCLLMFICHSIGQKKPVHVYQLIAENTVESKVLDIQEKKKQLIKEVCVGCLFRFFISLFAQSYVRLVLGFLWNEEQGDTTPEEAS